MAKFESFTRPPHSAHVGFGQRKPTMMDRQLAQMRLMREEEDARITNDEQLRHELFDFTNFEDTDEYGFPKTTKFQIPDSVSDVYVPQSKEKDAPQEKDVTPGSDVPPPSE